MRRLDGRARDPRRHVTVIRTCRRAFLIYAVSPLFTPCLPYLRRASLIYAVTPLFTPCLPYLFREEDGDAPVSTAGRATRADTSLLSEPTTALIYCLFTTLKIPCLLLSYL
jgi:hypothetical protein